MTEKQKELLEDEALLYFQDNNQKIADLIRENDAKITDLKLELEQERVISDGYESVIKEFQKLIDDISKMSDIEKIRKYIKDFNEEINCF